MAAGRLFRYVDSAKAKRNLGLAGDQLVLQDSVCSFKVDYSYDLVMEGPTSYFGDV